MTTKQMDKIMDEGTISQCSESEKKQIFNYAFGGEFMASTDKGALKPVNHEK